jgi:putative ABC transport system permease protein
LSASVAGSAGRLGIVQAGAGSGGEARLGTLARIAWRDLRGSRAAALIILACLTLGVATITGIGSLRQSVTDTVSRDARVLLGGDLVIESTNRALPEGKLAAVVPSGARVSHSVVTNAIAFAENGRQVAASLKAVDDLYPLYGQVAAEPAQPLAAALVDGGALAEESLLQRLQVAVGDRLELGNGEVEIRGVLVSEPDRLGGFVGLGPRLMIHQRTLEALGILAPGALARHSYGLALAEPEGAPALAAELRRAHPDAHWRAQTFENVQPRIARNADRLASYLSLAGIAALLIGGLGVGIVVDAHLRSRQRTIATWRCIGTTTRDVAIICGLQIVILCAAGLLLGALLGTLLPFAMHLLPAGVLPIELAIGVHPMAVLLAALFALATAALFTALPLLRATAVTPAALFRDTDAPAGAAGRAAYRHRWPWLLGAALVLAATALVAVPDPVIALVFLGIVLVVSTVIAGLARLGLLAVGALAQRSSGLFRLALGQLRRGERVATASVVALAAGTAVLTTVLLVEHSISRELTQGRLTEAPSAIFIDIQPQQREVFTRIVGSFDGAKVLQLEPVLRARVVRIAGVPVDEAEIADNVRWTVRRDRGLSYRAEAPPAADIVAGEWWPADYAGPPLVSVEDEVAIGYGLGIGDTLTFNVLGRMVEAEIANLRREIDWSEGRVDFVFVLSPGSIDQAPHTLVATVDVDPAAQSQLIDRMAHELPNVTPFAISDLIARIETILGNIGLAVRLMALVTLLTGLAVLVSALAAARREQLRRSVLFKVVGAERRQIGQIFLFQYAMIGIVAAALGMLLGLAASYAVVRFALEMSWSLAPLRALAVPVAAVAATLVIGAVGLRRVLRVPAALILRSP